MHVCVNPKQFLPRLKALAGILDTKEYAALTLGFTAPEGKFQVRARGLSFVARLLEGRFPPWKEVFVSPETSKTALRVMDPRRLLQILKETTRYTTRESRATELRLRGHVLTIVVENDQARTTRELVVRNLSEAPDKEASLVINPLYLLEYLTAETSPSCSRFPQRRVLPSSVRARAFACAHAARAGGRGAETGVPHPNRRIAPRQP